MVGIPRMTRAVLGEEIELELESVLGFGEVLHRIVVTIDAELSVTQAAEGIMLNRWQDVRRHRYSDPSSKVPLRDLI